MGNLAGGRAMLYGTNTPTTRNAWSPDDERYSPSGSSAGTGTAVAARLAVAGLGTQTGGSVIGPSNAQGLTAIKPTFGRISLHGVIPLSHTRDHVGAMARDAMDAAILLQVLAKPDPHDPRTLGLPAPPNYALAATAYGGDRPRVRWPTRIGVWPEYLSDDNERVNELRRDLLAELESNPAVQIVSDVTLPDDWEVLTSPPLGGVTRRPDGLLHRASAQGRAQLRRTLAAVPQRDAPERRHLRESPASAESPAPTHADSAVQPVRRRSHNRYWAVRRYRPTRHVHAHRLRHRRDDRSVGAEGSHAGRAPRSEKSGCSPWWRRTRPSRIFTGCRRRIRLSGSSETTSSGRSENHHGASTS